MPEYPFLRLEWFLEKRSDNQFGKWKGHHVRGATPVREETAGAGGHPPKPFGSLLAPSQPRARAPADAASLGRSRSLRLGLEKWDLRKVLGCPRCSRCAPAATPCRSRLGAELQLPTWDTAHLLALVLSATSSSSHPPVQVGGTGTDGIAFASNERNAPSTGINRFRYSV